jgi:RNA polymerase sigma-70 factor (ECF subfamily)
VTRGPARLAVVKEQARPAGVGDVFLSYSSYVATIALRLIGRDSEVDDVVQEVFMAALDGLDVTRTPAEIKGWLATVTVRTATRRLRMRRLRSFLGLDSVANYADIAAGAKQEQAVMLARVYRILDGLPAVERVAWTLRHVEGEQLEEVAALCGCSLATAKRRIVAAQEKIDQAVSDG